MSFSKEVSKLTAIDIGDGGKPGEGLDLDDNPKTCAPNPDCSGGINNSLGVLAGLANAQLDKAVAAATVNLLLEYRDWKQGPINLAIYQAKLQANNPQCDVQKAALCVGCRRQDGRFSELSALGAVSRHPGLSNKVTAGGKGTNFPFSLPIQGGANLKIVIFGARIVGTVQLTPDGHVTAIDAILAGSVPKSSLLAAIAALPEEGLPIPKAAIQAILQGTVEDDIDSDGDGIKDAASIGLKSRVYRAVSSARSESAVVEVAIARVGATWARTAH